MHNVSQYQILEGLTNYYLRTANLSDSNTALGALSVGGGTIIAKSFLYQIHTDDDLRSDISNSINCDLEFIFQTIENSDKLTPTFCNGLAGTGWLLYYLKDLKIINYDLEEYLEEIDQLLAFNLDIMISENYFDILHGYMGLGLYFLKRGKLDLVEKIIKALFVSGVKTNNEIKWKSTDWESRLTTFNFSLSHGNASITYFLGKCYSYGVCKELCKEMIDGLFNFFFNNMQSLNENISYFPNMIDCAKYESEGKAPQNSRLAWCYGDLGILNAIYLTAKWINNDQIADKALRMLLDEVDRKEKLKNSLSDAGFCHGTSGVGYIYLNLYNLTGNEEFNKVAKYWLQETINMSVNAGEEIQRFLFPYLDAMIPDLKLISGLPGVFALLINWGQSNIRKDWNECFFLS